MIAGKLAGHWRFGPEGNQPPLPTMKVNIATISSLALLGVSFPALGHEPPKNTGCPHCAAAQAKAKAHHEKAHHAKVRGGCQAGDVKSSFSGRVVLIGPDGKKHEYSFGPDGKKLEGKAGPQKLGGDAKKFHLEFNGDKGGCKIPEGAKRHGGGFHGQGGHGPDLSKLLEMALRHSGEKGAQPKFRFEHGGPPADWHKDKGGQKFEHGFDFQKMLEQGLNDPELQKLAQKGFQKLAEEGLQNGSLEEMLKLAQGAAGNGALDKLAEEGLQNGNLEELLKLAQGAAEDGTMDKLLGEFLGGLGGQLVPAPEAPAAPKAKKPVVTPATVPSPSGTY